MLSKFAVCGSKKSRFVKEKEPKDIFEMFRYRPPGTVCSFLNY